MIPKKIVFTVNDVNVFQALGEVANEAIIMELTEDQRTFLELKMGKNSVILSCTVVKE